MIKSLTCIECPMGCSIEVEVQDGVVKSVTGNSCPRGKMYAENEVICPKRVVTSTVRLEDGGMLSVKTDRPIRKDAIFEVMAKIHKITARAPISIGDVIMPNIMDDANLVATDNKG